MATMQDLHALALGLPETEGRDWREARVEYTVRGKAFCRHREPRKDAVDADGERMDDVLMFRTADLDTREVLLAQRPDVWFITDHFVGYPAVLARIPALALLSHDELDDVVVEAWLAVAPKRVAKAWLAEQDAAGD